MQVNYLQSLLCVEYLRTWVKYDAQNKWKERHKNGIILRKCYRRTGIYAIVKTWLIFILYHIADCKLALLNGRVDLNNYNYTFIIL